MDNVENLEVSNQFLDEMNSMLEVKADFNSKEFDYTWIEKYETVLPYIDNILRNPKRFIVNEEEVVKVELSKKVTVESIIHLTQHTNFIQDYDDKTGDVKPSKVLNINKEESLDTYENRFIYTLLNNMISFYEKHAPLMQGESYYIDQKEAKYEANTKIGNENIKISLHFESLDKKTDSKDNNGTTIAARLKKIKTQLDGFTCTELYQTLTKMHVPIVRSPIRKTNVILKNPNFQQAVIIWNYLQSYDEESCVTVNSSTNGQDVGEIKAKFDQSFLLDYLALNALSYKKDEVTERKAIALALSRVIENILDMNDEVLEDKIKKVFGDEFRHAKERFDRRNNRITNIFNSKMNTYLKNIDTACSLLD